MSTRILFLRAVFSPSANIVENTIVAETAIKQNAITQQLIDKYESDTNYTTVPEVFYGLDSWPKKINMYCNYCTCKIPKMPVFIPGSIDNKDGTLVIRRNGNGVYCRFSCASAAIDLYYPQLRNSSHQMLRYLYSLFNRQTIIHITPSLPKDEMKKYGGVRTEVEYQQLLDEIEQAAINLYVKN